MQLMIISNHKDFKHVLVHTINNNIKHSKTYMNIS